MRKLLNKFIFLFLTFLLVFGAILPNLSIAKAADVSDLWFHEWYGETNPFVWYDKVYDQNVSPSDQIFGERYTAAQVQWVTYGAFSMLWNLIPGNPGLTTCVVNGDENNCVDTIIKATLTTLGLLASNDTNNSQNAVGAVLNTIGQSPISSVAYFKDVSSRLTFVTPVKAADSTGATLAGASVINLWRVTRNISYALAVIAIIVLAFMIMFRVKISPQVVISVQSAIPKLAITLILVTFSYAIAGLMVDLMYVIIGFLAMILNTGGLTSESVTKLFSDFTGGSYSAVGLMYTYWMHFVVATLRSIILSGPLMGVLAFLLAILSIIAILFWSVKILFVLVKNFAMIMITIVTGPLEILVGSVTNAMGFGTWFKKLVSYLAVYPVMILMFFMSFFFLDQGWSNTAANNATNLMPFTPTSNLIGSSQWMPPFSPVASSAYQLMWVLVSFFIFSQITKVSEIIQAAIAGKPFEYGNAIGDVTGAAGTVGGGARNIQELAYRQGITLPRWINDITSRVQWLSSVPGSKQH